MFSASTDTANYTGAKYTRVRGHCLGLFPDETPHMLEDVDYVIKENMVLIAHPNTYLPLSGYMVFGDTSAGDGDRRPAFEYHGKKAVS